MLRQANPTVADSLAASAVIVPLPAPLSASAAADLQFAISNHIAPWTHGIPNVADDVSASSLPVRPLTINGQQLLVTDQQYLNIDRRTAQWTKATAQVQQESIVDLLKILDNHIYSNNFTVRYIADKFGGVELPDRSTFAYAISLANTIMALLNNEPAGTPAELIEWYSPRIVLASTLLQTVIDASKQAEQSISIYLHGTIEGAAVAVGRLETVRNVSFGVAAGLAGAVAAPFVFAAAGGGVLGSAAAVAGATEAGATVGSALSFTGGVAEQLAYKAATPGEHSFDWGKVGAQTRRGLREGAIAGALSAPGALLAPGISGAVGTRLFGSAEAAAATFAKRFAVGATTGLIVGAPTGAAHAAVTNAADLASGKLTARQYFLALAQGAAVGGVIAAGGAVVQTSGLYRSGGQRFNPFSGTPTTPGWMIPGNPLGDAPASGGADSVATNGAIAASPAAPTGYRGPTSLIGRLALWSRINFAEPVMRGAEHAATELIGGPTSLPDAPNFATTEPTVSPIKNTSSAAEALPPPAVATSAATPDTALALRPESTVAQSTMLSAQLSAPATRISAQQLATIPNIAPGEIQLLLTIPAAGWLQLFQYASSNRNPYSVKGKIAEVVYLGGSMFAARMQQAIQVAARLGISAEAVQFTTDVRGEAPTRTSSGGNRELTDGMFYAVRNGKLYVLGVVESKSPGNLAELAHKISGGKRESLGQPGWDFERLREVPTTVNGQTFGAGDVVVSRTFTRWIGVIPKSATLSPRSLNAVRAQVANVDVDNVEVSDDVLNALARLIIELNEL
ncbi:MAG: hypothetical protein ABJB74_02955 [Gemmatimonas sp.]